MTYCTRCDLDMQLVGQKSWQCPICRATFRRVSHREFHMQEISRLDQLVAREANPQAKKIFESHLRFAEDCFRKEEELEKRGVIFGEMEEWSSPREEDE